MFCICCNFFYMLSFSFLLCRVTVYFFFQPRFMKHFWSISRLHTPCCGFMMGKTEAHGVICSYLRFLALFPVRQHVTQETFSFDGIKHTVSVWCNFNYSSFAFIFRYQVSFYYNFPPNFLSRAPVLESICRQCLQSFSCVWLK